jgi:hypothetical protein
MRPEEIRKWHRDPRSKDASYLRTRNELPLIADMIESNDWSQKMRVKARRCVNFIERHEAQMKKSCTRRRLVALLNWGRKTPWCDLPSFGLA